MNTTQDLMNPVYQDCYFSENDGQAESFYIFIEGNHLPLRLRESEALHIGETGFGTGLNLLSLLSCVPDETSPPIFIKYSSLEKYPLTTERIRELLHPFEKNLGTNLTLYLTYWSSFHENLTPGWNRCVWEFPPVQLGFNLYVGDVRDWCREIEPCQVDAWFLDGHSPDKNPEMWSPPVLKSVYDKTAAGGTLASFTAAGIVKRPLREAGFFIKRRRGFGAKRHMIQGVKPERAAEITGEIQKNP